MGPGAWFNPLRAQILVHKMGLTMVPHYLLGRVNGLTQEHSSARHTIRAQYC